MIQSSNPFGYTDLQGIIGSGSQKETLGVSLASAASINAGNYAKAMAAGLALIGVITMHGPIKFEIH